jgi:hypothetical protein
VGGLANLQARPQVTSTRLDGKGKVTIEDIRAKLGEIRSGVDSTAQAARPAATYAAVGVVAITVLAAYLFGKRRGRRRSTWIEVRRL